MHTLRAFTWGYHGWGSASKEFVRAVDDHEKARGFLPPFFIDIRFNRSVRAANFREKSFEQIIGPNRYLWEKRLGNKQIGAKTGPSLQIADPLAASDVLDRIIELGSKRQRVVMFCSCQQALQDGQIGCHRTVVADLLLAEAKKRRIKLDVVEWPGDAPSSVTVTASADQERALINGLVYIPMTSIDGPLPKLATLGWGSQVKFQSASTDRTIITGPAYVKKGKWHLEILTEDPGDEHGTAASLSKEFCLQGGYGANGIR